MLKATFSILLNIVYVFSFLVPRNKKLWLFSAWNGKVFSDNSKHLFNHVLKTRPDIHALWVAKDKNLFATMSDAGLPCVYAYGLKGIFFQLTAGACFFSHSVDWDFCSYLISPSVKRIQLWHGMPIKRIGHDDKLNQYSSLKTILIKSMLPFRSEAFDFIIALGEKDKALYQTAFKISPDKVRITGFPRNDGSLVRAHQGGNGVINILYLPTFRGVLGSDFRLFEEHGFVFKDVDQWLSERNCKLHIKLHPVNKMTQKDLQAIQQSRNIAMVPVSDIYEQLHLFNVFVTDFSSVYFDFLVTGKPIILAPIGLANYLKKDRAGFYFDPIELALGRICSNWSDVFIQVDIFLKKGADIQEYWKLQKSFHRYLDGASSERVCREAEQLFVGS